ncbi:RNA polymerase sigma factor sigA-like protein [Tanacetum coccineum]
MMATTAVVGLRAGERLLGSSSYYSDVTEKLSSSTDLGFISLQTKNLITAKKSSNYGHGFISDRHNKDIRYIRALRNMYVYCRGDTSDRLWFKSLLEKQWHLSTEETLTENNPMEKSSKKIYVSGSEKSARRRRIDAQRKSPTRRYSTNEVGVKKPVKFVISPELLQTRVRGYAKGIASDTLLTHTEVVVLSKKIKIGQHLEERKSRLKERLGYEPSEAQLADSLRISRAELQMKQIECKLAREKLALSNVRLVMSVAQKYASMGAEIGDLIQKIAKSLNMSTKKVLNATEAKSKVFSIDRPVCPSLNGLPGDTIHSYMADDHPGNDPWHGVDHGALKDEVNKLMTTTLREREREIIRLYYGLDNEFLTWEDISRRMGLSRERVRQVGLVALEKLKHAARKTNLEAMLVEY